MIVSEQGIPFSQPIKDNAMNQKVHVSKDPLTKARAVAEANKIIIEELTSMAIHDVKQIKDGLNVERVPGGWNYIYYRKTWGPGDRRDRADDIVALSFVALPKSLSMGY